MTWNKSLTFLAGAALIAAALVLTSRDTANGQGAAAVSGPRYTIVETQGHNLLVTDNSTNTVYFYAIDKDEKIGADLKLRASVDLTQVGKDVIKIKKHK